MIIIEKYPVSSEKFYFRYVFSDNFIFIIVFFTLLISDFKNATA